MKKLPFLFVLLLPALFMGAIGPDASFMFSPSCVSPGETYNFGMTINFSSPDAEKLIFAQFQIGDGWELGQIEDPPAGSIPGNWTHVVNGSGDVVSWTFNAEEGEGGGVEDGESVTFSFSATVGPNPGVLMYIEDDMSGSDEPHTMTWAFDYPECGADDDADDDAADDTDDWHHDDDSDSWHTDDDTSADDTSADDATGDDFSGNGDDTSSQETDSGGGSTGCGC